MGDGFITFLPADGKGPSAGGAIDAGHFDVSNLVPGPKFVKVEAIKKLPVIRSSEEMAKRSAVNKIFGDGSGLVEPADIIPPNAEGNNEKVDIQPGKQTRDFHLKKPAARKGR